MCGYVATRPGCHHASRQASGCDGGGRGERLGGCSASDLFNILEVYRGEKKGADDVDERATDPTEEAQEIDLIFDILGILKRWKLPSGLSSVELLNRRKVWNVAQRWNDQERRERAFLITRKGSSGL